MPSPLSVVIPTLNAARVLPATLETLMEGLSAGLIRDLVVSDGGSGDGTSEIAEAAGAKVLIGPPGRGSQIARGVSEAQADWLLILHADTWLPSGWSEAVAAHMASGPDRAACFRLAFRSQAGGALLVAAWANFRTRAFHLPYGDQGLLIHRTALESVGGMPLIPLMEDVALARALKGRIHTMPLAVQTSAARYEAEGWIKCGARNLWTLARYLRGVDPTRLARDYASRN